MNSSRSHPPIARFLASIAIGISLTSLVLPAAAAPLSEEGIRPPRDRFAPSAVMDTIRSRQADVEGNVDIGDALGTCYTFQEVEGQLLPPLAAAAGSRWDRFDFRWNVIEGEDVRLSPPSYGPHDAIVDRDVAHGFNIIGILGSTPKWAAPSCHVLNALSPSQAVPAGAPVFPLSSLGTDDAYWWRPCPPEGLYLDWDHAGNVWGNYVYQTVSHFKDRVSVWEIWNEPDLGQIFWSGSLADYAQLLKVGYQATKAADPGATVLFAGLAYWGNPSYYVAVLDALQGKAGAAENNYFFDAMSLHLYSSIYQIRPIAAEIHANMASRVGPHPIWLTETGVPLWDEWPADFPPELRVNRATAEEAAAYVIEAFSESRAAGIEKFLFFRTHDEYMSAGALPDGRTIPEYFGLIRNDLSLRPAYTAFHVAAHYLQGENQVTGPFSNDGMRRITFWGTPQGRVDVLWNETATPLTYTLPAYLPTATVVDMTGGVTSAPASDNVFTLTLPAATANTAADGSYLIGGSPLLVIQRDTVPPTATLHTLPPVMYTNSLTLTWDVIDEGAGYWYGEIEHSATPDGPWEHLVGWPETQGVTQTALTVSKGGQRYFRARTRDNAGNWESWPYGAEATTTVIVTRTVAVSATAFIDLNSNDLQDLDELLAPDATLVWLTAEGVPVAGTTGSTLRATETVTAGTFVLTARRPGYLTARVPFAVRAGPDVAYIDALLALKQIRAIVYLPLIARQP